MYERLKELCRLRGTTVTKLCIQVTGNSGNLATWKKDYMRSDYLMAVAEALECSTDYLLGLVDNPNETYVSADDVVSATTPVSSDKTSEEFIKMFANMNLADRVAVMQFAFDKIGQNA